MMKVGSPVGTALDRRKKLLIKTALRALQLSMWVRWQTWSLAAARPCKPNLPGER
jgi:hypothetical protein